MPKDTFAYDVFISYSHADRAWVRGELLKRLQDAGLRIFIDFRDFDIGAPIVSEMERAVQISRKTLLVLTPAYLDSAWSEFEQLMLQMLDPASRERRLIGLRKAKCEIPLRIRFLNYVDFAEADDLDFAWSRLLGALTAKPAAGRAPASRSKPEPAKESAASPAAHDLLDLRKKLNERCSLDDVKDLCFALRIDYDNYPGTKDAFIRELLNDLERKGRIDAFVKVVREEKPWVLA